MSSSVKVKDFMQKNVIVFSVDMKIEEAIESLIKNKISGAPVTDKNGRLVGIVTEKDCMNYVIGSEIPELRPETVGELMNQTMETLDVELTLSQTAAKFSSVSFRRFPVVDTNGTLVGIVSRGDVLRKLKDSFHK